MKFSTRLERFFLGSLVVLWFVLLLIVIAIILTGITSLLPVSNSVVNDGYYPSNCTKVANTVCRVEDTEKDVVCYVYFQNSISCVWLGEQP